jgi:UDP-2,4-diacetamido-2,4,6-trideoxy-beta-L-altropyranose hydrolase
MNILLRADASIAMGTGHVMRCLALAEALQDRGCQCHFAAAELPEPLVLRLAAAGMEMHPIEAAADVEAAATLRLADRLEVAAAVVDGYQFSTAWRLAFARSGLPVLALSDDASVVPAGARLVLNAAAPPTANPPGVKLLFGPEYVLLRRDFSRAAKLKPRKLSTRRSILVTFGGTDPAGLTVPVATDLASALDPSVQIDVVIGGGVPAGAEVATRVAAIGFRVQPHIDVANMAPLMLSAGLAVSAAGGTMGELAALGVPAVLVTIADNQLASATAAVADGGAVMVDGRAEHAVREIVRQARALWADPARREALSARARNTVVIDGAERAADQLLAEIP